jgi:phosphoribosylanthranilate isomerase
VGEDFVMPEIDPFIRKVGVFVNASMDYVLDKVGRYALDFVQLHGDEDAAYCEALRRKVKVIKAFGVDERFDFHSLSGYLGKCDYFLFDTKVPEYGGSGRSFNWEVLNFYPYDQPFFLIGGIGLEEVKKLEVIQIRHLYAIDVNSRFETAPGKKDIQQVSQLISYKNELSR